MYQGTTIEELIEIVMKAEEQAHVAQLAEPQTLESYEGFVYELPQSSAVMIGVAYWQPGPSARVTDRSWLAAGAHGAARQRSIFRK